MNWTEHYDNLIKLARDARALDTQAVAAGEDDEGALASMVTAALALAESVWQQLTAEEQTQRHAPWLETANGLAADPHWV